MVWLTQNQASARHNASRFHAATQVAHKVKQNCSYSILSLVSCNWIHLQQEGPGTLREGGRLQQVQLRTSGQCRRQLWCRLCHKKPMLVSPAKVNMEARCTHQSPNSALQTEACVELRSARWSQQPKVLLESKFKVRAEGSQRYCRL